VICSHVNFETPDRLKLPGLLFEPKEKTNKVLISLHGNGNASVFYRPEGTNSMAEELDKIGVSYFPFNNRGAHYVTKFKWLENGVKKEVKYGTAFELIKESVLDIDAAIKYLHSRGFSEFYLIGHSTGANKICVYDRYQKNNPVSKYILLGGGDDTGLYYQDMGAKKFFATMDRCKGEIFRGHGRKLVPANITGSIMSYQSLFDTINPDGDYIRFRSMKP
jgi:predicted alpha/beta hydrolase